MNKPKKEILLFSLILMTTITLSYNSLQAQGIHFEKGNMASIQQKAKAENKLIFMDVHTTWCGPCKRMAKEVFTNSEVGAYFNKKFINYKIDAEKGEGVNLAKQYRITSYPSLLIVDGNGNLILSGGYKTADEMLAFGKIALGSEKELAGLRARYEGGESSKAFILDYLSALKERRLPTENVLVSYLIAKGKKEWLSRENLILIRKYIQTPYNEVYNYLMEQKKEINSGFLPYALSEINKGYLRYIITERKGEKEVNRFISNLERFNYDPKAIAYNRFRAKMLTAKRDEDWDVYSNAIIDYVNAYALDQPSFLNNSAWAFYKNQKILDPVVLNQALEWVDMAIKMDPSNYNYFDTKAALLYKTEKKEEALKFANKAVEMMKKAGQDATETLALVEKIKAM